MTFGEDASHARTATLPAIRGTVRDRRKRLAGRQGSRVRHGLPEADGELGMWWPEPLLSVWDQGHCEQGIVRFDGR